MKRLSSAVPLSLLMLAFSLPSVGSEKEPASNTGTITEAPAASASASVASASAETSAIAAASAATSAAASTTASTAAAVSAPLNWKAGPFDIALLDQAKIKVPKGFAYLEQADARQFLRTLGNPTVDDVTGLFTGPGSNWLIVVRFNKAGYIKESPAPIWNADELLEALKKNTEQTNAIRQKDGVSETEIVGWVEKPTYDLARHRVIWAVSSRDKGGKEADFQSVNFNICILGREGYLSLNLVTDLAQAEQTKKYNAMLAASVVFNAEKKYVDYKEGKDPVAGFGIADLVMGNADSVAKEKKGQVPTSNGEPAKSKVSKFIKVIALVLLGVLLLGGGAGGGYYFIRKKRAAKMAADAAAPASAPAVVPEAKPGK